METPLRSRKGKQDDEIKIPPSPFLKKLGYGTAVSVLQMVRSPKAGAIRSPWALKMLNKKVKPTTTFGKRLCVEAELLRNMAHPNVVGFRMYNKSKLCLGMEVCDSSLCDLIEIRAEEGLDPYQPHQILKVALDIGKALDYIHTKVKILHGDMKSGNILINGDFEICKLCDFGVSIPVDENGIVVQDKNVHYVGTELWSAPEVINESLVISTKADMFSFGLVLWEMMSLSIPHVTAADTDDSVVCLDDDSMSTPLTCGKRPPVPEYIDEEVYKEPLALFCCLTEQIPETRPTAHHIVLCAEYMMEHSGDNPLIQFRSD